jgi:hypothetical protein
MIFELKMFHGIGYKMSVDSQRLHHSVVLAACLYETPFLKALGCEEKENLFEKSAAAVLFDEFSILICSRNSEMYPLK